MLSSMPKPIPYILSKVVNLDATPAPLYARVNFAWVVTLFTYHRFHKLTDLLILH